MTGALSPIKIVIWTVSVFPAALLLYSNQAYGPGLSPDSINYVAAARSFSATGDFLTYSGNPSIYWPPLYPTLLSFLSTLLSFLSTEDFDVVKASQFLNAAALIVITYVSAHYVYQYTRLTVFSVLTAIFIAVSTPLMFVAQYVWTEIIFSMLCLLSLYIFNRYLNKRSNKLYIALIIAAALAFLQRYAGFALILSISILFSLQNNRSIYQKAKDSFGFGLLSSMPLLFWVLRNYLQTQFLTGERIFSMARMSEAVSSVPYTVGRWFVPYRFDDLILVLSVVGLFFFVCVVAFTAFPRKSRKIFVPGIIVFVFVAIYSFFIIYASSTACCVERFMAPIYPEIIILLMFVLYCIFEWWCGIHKLDIGKFKKRSVLFHGTAILLIPFVFVNITRTVDLVDRSRESGLGLTGEKWVKSETISFLKSVNGIQDGVIFSNRPEVIYYYLDLMDVFLLPAKGYYYHEGDRDQMPDFIRDVEGEERPIFIVWFNRGRSWLYDVEEIGYALKLDLVQEKNDGSVYMVRNFN